MTDAGPHAEVREVELMTALAKLRQRLATAAEAVGRRPGEVELLAVTKYFPASDVAILCRLGQRSFGEAREQGDLRENGGYHAAREEQGQQEARIRQLQELLNNAKVGEAPKQSGVALPGSVVKVYYDGDKSDTETFLIGTREQGVNGGDLEVYSPSSPLGGALLDAKVGDTRTYTVPNGNTVQVTLVSAEPYHS